MTLRQAQGDTMLTIQPHMNVYYVYILKCSTGSFYTGVCNNIERRITEHQDGLDTECYTYKRRPVRLVYQEECGEILESIAREKQIKGWCRAKKQALIKENWHRLVQLSRSYSNNSHPSTGSG